MNSQTAFLDTYTDNLTSARQFDVQVTSDVSASDDSAATADAGDLDLNDPAALAMLLSGVGGIATEMAAICEWLCCLNSYTLLIFSRIHT